MHVQGLAGQGEMGLTECLVLGGVGVHQASDVLGQGFPAKDQLGLTDLLAHPATLKAAGDAARTAIISRHTWDHHIERYERLFDELVAERKSERSRS